MDLGIGTLQGLAFLYVRDGEERPFSLQAFELAGSHVHEDDVRTADEVAHRPGHEYLGRLRFAHHARGDVYADLGHVEVGNARAQRRLCLPVGRTSPVKAIRFLKTPSRRFDSCRGAPRRVGSG